MSPETLLATKLHLPHLRPELVTRPRLTGRLDVGLDRPLTLVSAPAGFGKTTLINEWVKALGDAGPPRTVAWLSLDEGDNDPTRFLNYVVAALGHGAETGSTLAERTQALLQSPGLAGAGAPPVEAVLTFLINELADRPHRTILVLDDFHLIQAQAVHDALSFLLDHLPPPPGGLHLVIAGREDPHLPLARLRARGQLTEIRAADLRFTEPEAAQFLNQVLGLDLSAGDIAVLERRTEGWIAGLQLAAISMQGRDDLSGFVEAFSGSHRFVLDYLLEEVLEQQPESIRAFLLHTAVLDRMTGSLCDSVTGADDCQETLEYLEHANLFIIPLDAERSWYRYHNLFADLLRQRLRQAQPELVPGLHRRASAWFEAHGFADQAIGHALHGEDFEGAAHLIEEHVDAMWQRGEHARMRHWLEGLPLGQARPRPRLSITRAYYLFAAGQLEAGERLLRDAEQALGYGSDSALDDPSPERSRLPDGQAVELRGRIAVIRALISADQGDVPALIRQASQALEYLPEQDLTWRGLAAITLGDAHSYLGDMTASYQARSEARRACEAAGNIYYVILANLKLASTLRAQGRLRETVALCQQQLDHAQEYGLSQANTTALLLSIWGEALAELGDLDGALQQAEKGADLADRGINVALVGHAYLCLMRVLYSRSDLDGIQEVIRKVERLDHERDAPPWLLNQTAIWQVRVWLARDNLTAASQWAVDRGLSAGPEHPLPPVIDYYLLFEYIMLARVRMAEGRLEEAGALLQELLAAAKAGGRVSCAIEILLLQALALEAAGDAAGAVSALERALALAEPEGFVRTFVDEGQPLARLLHRAAARGAMPDYAGRLLSALETTDDRLSTIGGVAVPDLAAGSGQAVRPLPALVEPLSGRELEVLQLIAQGLTNREIGQRLFLSLNTVKAHTRNLYGKLGVHSRTQAVALARDLGLLET